MENKRDPNERKFHGQKRDWRKEAETARITTFETLWNRIIIVRGFEIVSRALQFATQTMDDDTPSNEVYSFWFDRTNKTLLRSRSWHAVQPRPCIVSSTRNWKFDLSALKWWAIEGLEWLAFQIPFRHYLFSLSSLSFTACHPLSFSHLRGSFAIVMR